MADVWPAKGIYRVNNVVSLAESGYKNYVQLQIA